MTSRRLFATILLLAFFDTSFSDAVGKTEYHLYYVAGGYTANTLWDDKRSIHFLTKEMAAHGPSLKQYVTHNSFKNLCTTIRKNYMRADSNGKEVSLAIFSFSWGVPETMRAARCLDRHGIPIELIIALDPIPKGPGSIGYVPENVDYLFNLFSLEGGIVRLFNSKRIRPLSPHTKVFNQRVPGKISHSDFDNGVQHCSLNLLYNWIEGYRMRPRPCEVRW